MSFFQNWSITSTDNHSDLFGRKIDPALSPNVIQLPTPMQYISCDLPSDFPTTATHATDPTAHYATDPAAYATDPAAGMFNPLLTGFSE